MLKDDDRLPAEQKLYKLAALVLLTTSKLASLRDS